MIRCSKASTQRGASRSTTNFNRNEYSHYLPHIKLVPDTNQFRTLFPLLLEMIGFEVEKAEPSNIWRRCPQGTLLLKWESSS